MINLSNKKLLHVALCGILSGTLAGCHSGSKKEVPITDRAWQAVSCSSEAKMDLLTGLGVSDSIDGLVIFSGGVQLPPQATVVGGSPCNSALDVAYCESLLSESTRDGLASSLVVTSGDEVRVIEGSESVKAFLGELDTPQKVFLWMHVNNMAARCDLTQSAVALSDDGLSWYGLFTELTSSCAPVSEDRVEVAIGFDGSIVELKRNEIYRDSNLCIGRVPPGKLSILEGDECGHNRELGKMFAKNAAYEAASVVAFTHLKSELEFYGAPQTLINKLQVAANDEHRHAQQVGDLAQRFGCSPDEFTVEPSPIRSLEQIAMDNLIEGCVGETWGALVGLYQSENAEDAGVRATMKNIADDEVGHAALSWEINEWLRAQLDEEARATLDTAKTEAVARLKQRAAGASREAFELAAGLPSPAMSQKLVDQLSQAVVA